MKKIATQNILLVPGFSGGYALPSFSNLTASQPVFICNEGWLLPEQIISGSFLFFQAVHNVLFKRCVQKNIVFQHITDKGFSLPLSAFCVYMKYRQPRISALN